MDGRTTAAVGTRGTGRRTGSWGVYKTIAESIRGRIASGEFVSGLPLPSEAQLTAEYCVSRGTLRRSLAELATDGLVTVRPGRKRMVTAPDSPGGDGGGLDAGYQRIARDLRQRIERGEVGAGGRLPSGADVIARYGVSRGTVRQAFRELQATGLVVAVQGKGRYARERSGGGETSEDV